MAQSETNIFEGAKFGDKFLTNGNEIAIYQNSDRDEHGRYHNLITPSRSIFCEDNGHYTLECDVYPNYNIVSRYQQLIDEEKLDELAKEYAKNELKHSFNIDDTHTQCCISDFKAGYRKAKE